ncbi:MAG: DUF2726 domain-containing protein [Methylococcaceae bacterium]|jgi:hypothetical protein
MNWFMLAWTLVALLTVGVFLKLIRTGRSSRNSYQRQDFLLSPEARHLFKALQQASGEDYIVFGNIRVDDVITPRFSGGGDPIWDALETTNDSHFPFVLCNKSDLSIACGIQLKRHKPGASPSHDRTSNPLKAICVAAGLPLVRLEAGPFYDLDDIRMAIAEAVRKEPLFMTEADVRREPSISELGKTDL